MDHCDCTKDIQCDLCDDTFCIHNVKLMTDCGALYVCEMCRLLATQCIECGIYCIDCNLDYHYKCLYKLIESFMNNDADKVVLKTMKYEYLLLFLKYI